MDIRHNSTCCVRFMQLPSLMFCDILCFGAVDQHERGTGNNPEKELLDNGFLDYQRPSVTHSVFYNITVGLQLNVVLVSSVTNRLKECAQIRFISHFLIQNFTL